MMVACALFAFRNPGKRLTKEALFGALLEAEDRAVRIQFAENFGEFCKAWVKSKKSRAGGKGRRR